MILLPVGNVVLLVSTVLPTSTKSHVAGNTINNVTGKQW
jgi:hypothetical protein